MLVLQMLVGEKVWLYEKDSGIELGYVIVTNSTPNLKRIGFEFIRNIEIVREDAKSKTRNKQHG